jgi:hypothetical protein
MPLPYNQNKIHIYKWRENNVEKYNEICRKNMKLAYDKQCYFSYERHAKLFRKIGQVY